MPWRTLTDWAMSEDWELLRKTERKAGTVDLSRTAMSTTERDEPLGHSTPSIKASGRPPAVSSWPDCTWSDERTFHQACCSGAKKPWVS